jgi:Putative phage metallopeptidase
MADLHEASEQTYDLMRGLIAKYHPDLASVDKEIAIITRPKAGKSGGQVILGKTRKAPGILGVLGTVDYKFIIELAQDEWNNLTDKQREALMDHHLCACNVDIDEDSGEIKCSLNSPDFVGFRGELERHGIWRTPPADQAPGLTSIEQMFGEQV